MALSAGKITAETVVSSGTQRTGQVGAIGKEMDNNTSANPLDAADAMTKLMRSVKTLKTSISTQDGGLKLLFQKAAALEVFSEKSRSPSVKEAIQELLAVVDGLEESREQVVRAFNATLISTLALESNAKSPAAPSGQGVSASCQTDEAVPPATRDSETQTPCWWDLCNPALQQTEPREGSADRNRSGGSRRKRARQRQRQQQQRRQSQAKERPDPLQQQQLCELGTDEAPGNAGASSVKAKESGFTVVSRRKARDKSSAVEPKAAVIGNGSTGRRRVHRKQAVILERPPGSASYADMLKAAKAAVQEEKLSIDVSARRAKSGNIVIEISGKEEADNLAGVLKAKMGSSVEVRRPSPSVSLRLTGIEDSIDEAELKSALTRFDGDLKDVRDIRISEGKNGVRYTTVRAPIRAGLRLIEARKIKVGWAVCRVREIVRETGRCDKCKEHGHTSKACTGPERRKCFRCQATGHLIAECSERDKSETRRRSEEERTAGRMTQHAAE